MSNIEKIRQEIERRMEACKTKNGFPAGTICAIRIETYEGLLSFINSLPDENNPEPYNPVYDEDYLNEKIAKATKSWEGVDVDAMLAECRGYEEKPSEDLEEEASRRGFDYVDNIVHESPGHRWNDHDVEFGYRDGFIAGAECQKEQMELYGIVTLTESDFDAEKEKASEWGYNLCKEQMMKRAVEGEIGYWNQRGLSIRLDQSLEKLGYGEETEVKIIIVKD